jgi:hypothetical protein
MDLVSGVDKGYSKAVHNRLSRAGSRNRRSVNHLDPAERLKDKISRKHDVVPEVKRA